MTSLKKLVDVHRPSRNELLGPAATYQASAPCVVADQERVLRHLGVGRASSDWTSASTKESKLRPSHQASPKGCPKNWQHVKSDLVKYLSRAEQNLPMQTFSCKSAGALNLDKGKDPLSPTKNIVNYPAPGCISVSVHGLSPIDRETGRVQDFRKDTPFWDGTSNMLDDGCRSTAQIVDKLNLDPADDSPIFLNSCNAGTESQGYTPAADMAKHHSSCEHENTRNGSWTSFGGQGRGVASVSSRRNQRTSLSAKVEVAFEGALPLWVGRQIHLIEGGLVSPSTSLFVI